MQCLMLQVWYIYYGNGTEPLVVLSVYALIFCVFCLGLSVGVVFAVGMLLYFQVRYFTIQMQCSDIVAFCFYRTPDIYVRNDLNAVRNWICLRFASLDVLYRKIIAYQISPKWIILCKLRKVYT